ncbi:hypothetical protein EAI91_07760 [Lacticaseibacillus paracasei]|nr:hypothetical protein LPEG9_03605 [Lacticaseibacillus paracasei]MCT4394202.1 hypothetical protein [Lacticaseibacillus paracasei]OPH07615.1 hypothetical protein B4585_04110 [Lacticaseibacillus paracasei]PTS56899.1 hypothetical protein DBQ61_07715 [Lactobacillus sp. DS22_6]RYS98712.1 hypothetical protein EAI91_07760 [Lacticaseibacillus paracasei]
MTRSPAQQPACKDLGRNGQKATITSKAAYIPVANRAGSRSLIKMNGSEYGAREQTLSQSRRQTLSAIGFRL